LARKDVVNLEVVRVAVATTAELPPGTRRIVDAAGRSIGVFNVGGEYFALRNRCPHQGGPLCLGETTGTTKPVFPPGEPPTVEWERDGEILRCPWHAWEFDMRTGDALIGEAWRVATYQTFIDSDTDQASPRADADIPPPVEIYKTSVADAVVYVEVPLA
jgi:3-phenylpropionate/trans-cinnamate dioxygenase ferredoxin subunit